MGGATLTVGSRRKRGDLLLEGMEVFQSQPIAAEDDKSPIDKLSTHVGGEQTR
jgi:hypothetical protein